jgi:hypothetical protein
MHNCETQRLSNVNLCPEGTKVLLADTGVEYGCRFVFLGYAVPDEELPRWGLVLSGLISVSQIVEESDQPFPNKNDILFSMKYCPILTVHLEELR